MNSKLVEILRKRRGYTQAQFAELIGYTTTGYQKMMEKNELKVSTLESICTILNVKISAFFESDDKQQDEINIPIDLTDTVNIDLPNRRVQIFKKKSDTVDKEKKRKEKSEILLN